jgi:hypothetical protein
VTGVKVARNLHINISQSQYIFAYSPSQANIARARLVEDTPYMKHFVDSVFSTLSQSEDAGYDVVLYVGYDRGDKVWDSDHTRATSVPLMLKKVHEYTHRLWPSIGLFFKLVGCDSRSMVAASNCAIKTAYDDGAEYWYRVNDDTNLHTPNWIRDFISTLANFKPPNLGVVGPVRDAVVECRCQQRLHKFHDLPFNFSVQKCKQGNTKIMTYDFVHRTHLEVFGWHYPPSLGVQRILLRFFQCYVASNYLFAENWWCDDWISRVYGKQRTQKVDTQEVVHLMTGSRCGNQLCWLWFHVAHQTRNRSQVHHWEEAQGQECAGRGAPQRIENGQCGHQRVRRRALPNVNRFVSVCGCIF